MKLGPRTIKHLSREEKLQLLDLIEEKKRRDVVKRPKYMPNPGQLEVHLCRKIDKAIFSGNAAGKTALLVNEMMWAARGYNPILKENTFVPARIYLVLDKAEKMDAVIIPEIRKWFPLEADQLHKKGKAYTSEIKFSNGSFIRVITHEMSPMSCEGLEISHAFYDEPPPRDLYVALKRGGRTKGQQAKYIICGTPLAAPWLRTEIYEPWSRGEKPDTECFKFSTHVNEKNLASGYIDQFSAVLSEKEKQIRLHGAFFDLDGLALAHLFRRDVHVVDASHYNLDDPCVVAIDPHPSKAHVAVLLSSDSNGYLYVVDEFSAKQIPRDFAKSLIKRGWFTLHRVLDIVYDSLGSADGTGGEGFKTFGQVVNEELAKADIGRARATSYQEKSDEDFVARIQSTLEIPKEPNNYGQKVPKLRIFNHCKGVISDIENAQWMVDKNGTAKPKLDIRNLDYLAALKYALATNLYYNKRKNVAYTMNTRPYSFKGSNVKSAR